MSVKYLDCHHGVRVTADTRHACEGVRIAWLEDTPYAIISLYDDDSSLQANAVISLTELNNLHDTIGIMLHLTQQNTALAGKDGAL